MSLNFKFSIQFFGDLHNPASHSITLINSKIILIGLILGYYLFNLNVLEHSGI